MMKVWLPDDIQNRLESAGLQVKSTVELIDETLDEDLAYGPDATTNAIFDASVAINARMVSRDFGCLAGVPISAAVPFVLFSKGGNAASQAADIRAVIRKEDGEQVRPGDVIIEFHAPARIMLTAERTLLNLASQLSGVATHTASFVDALKSVPNGTKTAIRDTRKTIPGLRVLQKYAVRCGGGVNHRMGLGDAALIKDNHIAAAGSLTKAVEAVRASFPGLPLEVECDTLDQVREAVQAGVQLLLLDNMTPEVMGKAVALARNNGVKTEASGGLTLPDVPATAATGVDFISVGALTHSSPILDLALDL